MSRPNNEGDLRVRRTRKLLWDALMALITERDFDSVSVNDICDRAMVHRTTFYNHYQDKYDLLNSGMLEMYEELRVGSAPPDAVMQRYDPDHPPAYFVGLLQHVLDNRHFYAAMLRGSGLSLFRERLHAYLIDASLQRLKLLETAQGNAAVPLELVAYFDAGAILNAVAWWAQHGFHLTPLHMAQHLMQLLGYGTMGVFGNPKRLDETR